MPQPPWRAPNRRRPPSRRRPRHPALPIGDFVWLDADGDGLQDAGEPGLPGVVVRLLDAGGAVVGEDVTDEGGRYELTPTSAGPFTLEVVLPAGYQPTLVDVGQDDAIDSDADPANVVVGPAETTVRVDVGDAAGVEGDLDIGLIVLPERAAGTGDHGCADDDRGTSHRDPDDDPADDDCGPDDRGADDDRGRDDGATDDNRPDTRADRARDRRADRGDNDDVCASRVTPAGAEEAPTPGHDRAGNTEHDGAVVRPPRRRSVVGTLINSVHEAEDMSTTGWSARSGRTVVGMIGTFTHGLVCSCDEGVPLDLSATRTGARRTATGHRRPPADRRRAARPWRDGRVGSRFNAGIDGYVAPDVETVDTVAPGPHGDVPVRVYRARRGVESRVRLGPRRRVHVRRPGHARG